MQNRSLFTKGNLFYIKDYVFKDGSHKNKYLLVLNFEIPDSSPVLIVLPTSNTEVYKGISFTRRDNSDTLLIQAHEIPSLFPEETILDFGSIKEQAAEELIEYYQQGQMEHLGKLPDNYITQIEQIITGSKRITRKIKKRILEDL